MPPPQQALAEEVTNTATNFSVTYGDSIPAEFNKETTFASDFSPSSLEVEWERWQTYANDRLAFTKATWEWDSYYNKWGWSKSYENPIGGQLQATIKRSYDGDDGDLRDKNYREIQGFSLNIAPDKPTSEEFVLPIAAVESGEFTREQMTKLLQAASLFSWVGPLKYGVVQHDDQPLDASANWDLEQEVMFPAPEIGDRSREEAAFPASWGVRTTRHPLLDLFAPWYSGEYSADYSDYPGLDDSMPTTGTLEDFQDVRDQILAYVVSHIANPELDFFDNGDGTYSSTFPPTFDYWEDPNVNLYERREFKFPLIHGHDNGNAVLIPEHFYEVYKRVLAAVEAHTDTSANMLDVNLDTDATTVSLSADESKFALSFSLPTDKVWSMHGCAAREESSNSAAYWCGTRAPITFELYSKTDSGEQLVATATPSDYQDVDGVTSFTMTAPVSGDQNDFVLKAKANESLVSAILPAANANEVSLLSYVGVPANLVSAQPFSITLHTMESTVHPAGNGVIEADSASITVTDEITPKNFEDGTYKFVGEVRGVTDGEAGDQVLSTNTITATVTDGVWEPAAPLIQTFTDVPVEAGKRYVVYERAYRNDEETPYSIHEDVTDNDQSFLILKRVVPTIPTSTESTTTTATKEATVTSTTTETTTNTVTSTSWVVKPSVATETSTINETTTVVVPETETSTVTSTATAETTTVTTVPADSDVATETVIVNETTVVTSTTDAPVTTMPAETTTNTVTDTTTAVTTVIVDNGDNSGSAALSSKLPWWLVLIPVIPAVLGFIWNAVSQLQLPGLPAPAGSVGLFGAADDRNNPAPAPQPCERVSFRGHNLTWGVLAGTISLIFGQNVTDQCVNDQ